MHIHMKHDAHVTLHTIAAKHDLWSGVILSIASMLQVLCQNLMET